MSDVCLHAWQELRLLRIDALCGVDGQLDLLLPRLHLTPPLHLFLYCSALEIVGVLNILSTLQMHNLLVEPVALREG